MDQVIPDLLTPVLIKRRWLGVDPLPKDNERMVKARINPNTTETTGRQRSCRIERDSSPCTPEPLDHLHGLPWLRPPRRSPRQWPVHLWQHARR